MEKQIREYIYYERFKGWEVVHISRVFSILWYDYCVRYKIYTQKNYVSNKHKRSDCDNQKGYLKN